MTDTIKIADIDDKDRLRPIDTDHVEIIASSIEQQGLLQPIRVRPLEGGRFRLILGAHRLAALKGLGWVELKVGEHVMIATPGDYAAKVDEIDENLGRYELNALDRALFLAKRKEFYLLANPDATRGGDRKTQKYWEKIKGQTLPFDLPKGFGAQASKKVGLSKRTINLSIRLAEKLQQETIDALRGTKIERNQTELLALAALDPEQQIAVARAIHDGDYKTTRQAKLGLGFDTIPEKTDPMKIALTRFMAAWASMDNPTRAAALEMAGLTFAPAKPAAPKTAKK